jgi:hypothetical protein
MLFKPFFDVCDVTVMRKCRVRISARVCREIGKDARESPCQKARSSSFLGRAFSGIFADLPVKYCTRKAGACLLQATDRRVKGWLKEWVDGWVAKVDNRFGYEKWF